MLQSKALLKPIPFGLGKLGDVVPTFSTAENGADGDDENIA